MPFLDNTGTTIDEGIALFFPGPNSFTGEDVIEFQGHGGPVIMDMLLRRIVDLGARLARPGEFSERAFLNDRLDLAQAEAIADLIDAGSEQAARAAVRSLQGEFSQHIHQLVEKLIHLRIYVEAAIDFPEEEIDFLSDGKVAADLSAVISAVTQVENSAQQGALLQEGITIVIAGRPNAGKSSLLNSLSGRESAIVMDIPGTTRDILREKIHIDGMPLHIIDTAGLRESIDQIEQEGIRRAWKEMHSADHILLLVDAQTSSIETITAAVTELKQQLGSNAAVTVVRNKIDLSGELPSTQIQAEMTLVSLSAKTTAGLCLLRDHLKTAIGYQATSEGNFIARRRHLDALHRALAFLAKGQQQLLDFRAGELLADDLRQAQLALSEITGEFSADDLLGRIFSSFCIGK